MIVNKVRKQKNGYLVNGTIFVPDVLENRHMAMIRKYIQNGGEILSEYSLKDIKQSKLAEIKKAKKLYQNKSVPVDIDGTTYTFFGGKVNGEKYEDALNTALRLGLTEGTIKVEEGFITINKENMDKALGIIGLQGYRGWKKEQYYIETINNATTIEEIEAIIWEDEYKG